MKPVRTLIVDDEPVARQLLRSMLEREGEVRIVGEAEDGESARGILRTTDVDLVFLDVQMPEMSGFELIEAIGTAEMPPTVFVTAHDRYAVRAFDVHALDYVLKPYDAARLHRAVVRAVSQIREPLDDARGARVASMLEQVRTKREFPERIVVRTDSRILLLDLADVGWIAAEDKVLNIHIGKNVFTTRASMRALEEQLDPRRFVRIQRSLIVNVAHVRELQPWFQGDYLVVMRDGTKLTSGRTYRDNVQAILNTAALS